MQKYFFMIILVLFLLLVFSCQKDFSLFLSILNDNSENGLIATTGCKKFGLEKSRDEIDKNHDVIIYSLDDGVLEFSHINSGFNCCPGRIGANITVEDDKIKIVEYETEQGCYCLCLFDLDFKLHNIQPKIYEFTLHQLYLSDSSDVHHYFINFADSSQGSCSIKRIYSPWFMSTT